VLARGLSREFPNPERVGCPDSSILRGIASHKLPLAQAAPWFDHLSACSPCFQDFNKFHREATGQRRRVQVWLAAAAVLLFAFGGLLWVRSRPSGQTAAVVVLDLRGRATVRGQSTPETSQPSLEVPRNARNLNLELPIGSNEGAYDVALLNPSGAELFRTSATAKLEDHIVVLRTDVNLADISPGSYFLGLRQPGVEWMRFPIHVL
jgi:hypothetical protein